MNRAVEEACGDKQRFVSKAAATRHLVHLIEVKGAPDPMYVYECPYCFWWHYGHLPLLDGPMGLVRLHVIARTPGGA